MRNVYDAAWILLGAALGLTGCVVFDGYIQAVSTADIVPFLQFALFALLTSSAHPISAARSFPSGARRVAHAST